MKKKTKLKIQTDGPSLVLPLGPGFFSELIEMGYIRMERAEPIKVMADVTNFVSAYIFHHKHKKKMAVYATMRSGNVYTYDIRLRTVSQLTTFFEEQRAIVINEAIFLKPLKYLVKEFMMGG